MQSDKWVVVTGASTGIGRSTALHLSSKGYAVLAGVRRAQDGDALIAARGAGQLEPIILDVTQSTHIDDCVSAVRARTGDEGLKALVNNAGINYIAPFELADPVLARQLFEVNFFGVCALTQALIPLLRRYQLRHADRPNIVNVGSFGSTMGIPWEPYYHASKFALLGLSEALMFELKRQKVNVSVVLPGGIRTDFFDKTGQDIDVALARLNSAQRELYGHGLTAMKRPLEQFKSAASDPMLVAKTIERMIRSNRPPFRQLVGLDANFLYGMVRFLPTGLRQALLGPLFGA
jgi:NAD(P)-dependent dehydrogenase (short-subunit alcohol dehydrogenase family)